VAKGLCGAHYVRLKRTGSFDTTKFDPAPVRFWRKVQKTETCWNWTGAVARSYGHFMIQQKPAITAKAHRYAYEHLVGPIQKDMTVDHLCRNKLCVNPAHMEIVTASENAKRGNPLRATCKYGHAYDAENTYHYETGPRKGRRKCRTCERLRMRETRLRRSL